jgi:DnaD/phage-associated family protein
MEQQGEYNTGRKIEGSASGFTPCPDVLVEKYSHTTALVWGKVWRYCQMKDEVCSASILRLAKELNLSPNTIATHMTTLEKGGYVKDTTPDVRNKPHIYIDTGKLKLKFSLFMEETGTQNLSTGYSKTSHEESSSTPNIFKAYEENIGPLTTMIADSLQDAEKTYPAKWILDTFKLAVENNKRSWRYCEAILKRWQAEGKDDGKKQPPAPAHIPDMSDIERILNGTPAALA